MTTESLFLAAASAAALATLFVHLFIGGRRVARPLLADRALPRAAKWLSYYCWHIATLAIAFMAIMFAAAGTGELSRAAEIWAVEKIVAAGFALFAASLSALSVWVALKGAIHPLRFPSTSLFALIAALAAAAAMS